MSQPTTAADGKAVNAEKRRKYELKQKRKQEIVERESKRSQWIAANSHFACVVGPDDVENIRHEKQALAGEKRKSSEVDGSSMDGTQLAELIAPYLDLKESDHSKGLFIAEGTETVRLLVQQLTKDNNCTDGNSHNGERKPIQVLSILVRPSTFFEDPVKLISDVLSACSPRIHVLIASEDVQSRIAGFHIARGALACGVIPQYDEKWLDAFVSNRTKAKIDGGGDPSQLPAGIRILALDGISDTANMGAMIRCCAAFGIDLILLSKDCCDAWYRRSIRTSMGYIVSIPIVRCGNLSLMLSNLEKLQGISSFAAVIDLDSELVLERMERGEVPPRWCCVMGNEANGISKEVVASCSSRLRIGMTGGVDSLSVPVATGILLHGFVEREASTDDKNRNS